jgi:serine/threonine protein phosphatase PrpC
VIARLEAATDAASEAVLEVTRKAEVVAATGNPASCTFVAAVVEQDLLVVGSVGDSRAYWFPDEGAALALTVDDSFAQEQITSGVSRAEAETGPQSHAITRWLGVDAPDHTPTTATMTLAEPGWLLVCSDGLWNYCSEAEDLSVLLQKTSGPSPATAEPMALAGALVDWAIAQGGQDNITVALARIHPAAAGPTPAAPGSSPAVAVAAHPVDSTSPIQTPPSPVAPRSTPKGSPRDG